MGYTHVTITVTASNLQKSLPTCTASFLVDTGAIVCLAPSPELRKAGLEPEGRVASELANGTPVEYDYGFARVSFLGSDPVTKIIFGQDGVEPVLGVTALESVGAPDPADAVQDAILRSGGLQICATPSSRWFKVPRRAGEGVHFTMKASCLKRRPCFLTGILTLAAIVVLAGASSESTAIQTAGKPNVIVIFADDLGWGDLGCYGHPRFKTPNIDRLAGEGARLTDFYSTCPYCAPSRASLLTGRYQFRSGVTRNPTPDAGINDVGIPAPEITLGEAFHAAGYRTICIGKWHLGHQPEFYPTRHGFDEYLGILYSNDMRPVQLIDGEEVVEYPLVQATLTKRYTERALDFIRRHQDKPFFLYFPQAMPHKPLAASEAFYKKSGAGLYGDALAELDWSVGQILTALIEFDLDERTLVFFTSDNGPWYGGSTGGLRGMKGNCWEGGIREPLLARWPGKIPPGHVSHQPAMMPDIFATCLAAAGIPLPKDRTIDGKNIMLLLTSDAPSPHEAIFSMAGPRLNTIRSGQWKLHAVPPAKPRVWRPDEKWADPRAPDGVTILAPYEQAHPSQYPGLLTGDETKVFSLFDLESDPAEQHDVAAKNPEIVGRLRMLYDAMSKQVPAPAPPPERQNKVRN